MDEGKENKQFLIRVAFIEIYNECIHDLLSSDSRAKMELKEDPKKGVYIKDLTMNTVNNIKQMHTYMDQGNSNKSVGATAMNADSSRSHSVFTIFVESSEETAEGGNRFKSAKLNLVDLAGSERQDKTQATGDRLKEAQKINMSLSALGNVIQALVDGKAKHIPYRDSKLTRILQDSLGGNTRTLMIAAISPASDNYDETMSTLRYASRAKMIKNKPTVNMDPKDAMLAQYADEIKKLKEMLKNRGGETVVHGAITTEELASLAKLKEIEDRNREREEAILNKRKAANDRQALLAEEKRRQEELKRLMEEMENRAAEEKADDWEHEEIEQAKLDRELNMEEKAKEEKKEEKRLERIRAEEEIDQKLEKGEVPKQIQNLKQQYDRLLKKFKQKELELKDLDGEFVDEKLDYLEALRQQKKETRFLAKLIPKLISTEDIDKLRIKSTWDDNNNSFITPGFLLRNKHISMPKMPKKERSSL